MLLLHRIGLASTLAAIVVACSMTSVAAAPAAGWAKPLEASHVAGLVVKAHWDPTHGIHKQCLYGVYGTKGQYKGYHRHLGTYDRGHACAPFLNPGANLPAKLFRDRPPSRIRSPRLR